MPKHTLDSSRLRQRIEDRIRNATGRWYSIQDATGDKAVIRIYEEIGFFGVTAEDFASDLEAVTAPEIEVQISSPGGSVFESIAIYNALRAHEAKVTTRVDGIAASGASVIVQAGDHRVMLEASQMMIHEAWGVAIGPASEMREFADLLDKQSDVLARIYAERADGDAAELRDLMAAETWLTDEETVELGLADEVVKPKRQDAKSRAEVIREMAASIRSRSDRYSGNGRDRMDPEVVREVAEAVGDFEDFTLSELRELHDALRTSAGEPDQGSGGSPRTDPTPADEVRDERSESLPKEGVAALLAAFDIDQKENTDE